MTESTPPGAEVLFNAFLSYASQPDRRLARQTEAFLERIHNVDQPEGKRFRELRICLDGSDFDLGEKVPSEADETPVRAVLRKYLDRSASLVVFCSKGAIASTEVGWEIDWFADHHPERPIHIVVTEGTDPPGDPESVFPEPVRRHALHKHIWFDFRGAERRRRTAAKQVREFDEARLQLAAAIYGDGTTAADLSPGWYRQQRAASRRMAIIASIAAVVFAGLAGFAAYQAVRAEQARYAEETHRIIAEATGLDERTQATFSEARRTSTQKLAEANRLLGLRDQLSGSDRSSDRSTVLAEEIGQADQRVSELSAKAEILYQNGREFLAEADVAWECAAERMTEGERSRPVEPLIFSVEVLDARRGESVLVHYGTPDRPRLVVIDGAGDPGGFRDYLQPRLAAIREQRNRVGALEIELVIASQWDFGRLGGLIDLARSLLDQTTEQPPTLEVGQVWFNAPRPFEASYRKFALAVIAEDLGIPLNAPFGDYVFRPKDSAPVVEIPGGLKITVLNPTHTELQEYTDDLEPRSDSQPDSEYSPVPEATDYTLVRRNTGVRSLDFAEGMTGRDRSKTNRASLVLLFEFAARQFLYSGDANDWQIGRGLEIAGLVDADGRSRVNVLHIPNYGSDQNVSSVFFERVVADHYIVTGDGTFDNPEVEVLEMLLDARIGEVFRLHFAHRDGQRGSLGEQLDRFFAERGKNQGDDYIRVFRAPTDPSVVIDLLEPAGG